MRNWMLVAMATFTLLINQSCVAPKKNIYANDLVAGMDTADVKQFSTVHKIQVADVLQIQVAAADRKIVDVYNPNPMQMSGGTAQTMRGVGYTVSQEGHIDMPVIGTVTVAGLTAMEASQLIQQKISKYIIDPYVSVSILNFKVTMIGAVARPGVVTSQSDRLTILEALGQVGDMPATAMKDNVWVVREVNGERSYNQVNLNSKELFKSEYYYLRNNDVVYVQPNKFSSFFGANAPLFGTIGAISGVVAIIIALVN